MAENDQLRTTGVEKALEQPPLIEVAFPRETVWRPEVNKGLSIAHSGMHELVHSLDDEKENLLRIRQFLDQDLNDADFRSRLDSLRPLLPDVFDKMKGREQTPPHASIDPYDHTFNTLRELDTSGLSTRERHIARVVILFHDIGKTIDPKDKEHPRFSVKIATPYLEKMGYDQDQIREIGNQIRWHDLMGEVARRDGRNTLSVNDALAAFNTTDELRLHYAIVVADVSSIPGLKKYLPNIEATYQLLLDAVKSREEYIVPRKVERFPFEKPKYDKLYNAVFEYKYSQIGTSHFDDVNVEDDISRRKDLYESTVPIDAKEEQEKMLVVASVENQDLMLQILHNMGRETDRAYVIELEKKYNIPLDQLRVTVELFAMTYHIWEASYKLKGGDVTSENRDYYIRHLSEIVKSARFLSSYKLHATHRSPQMFAESIRMGEVIRKSVTSEQKQDYQGDGVYVGIDGSFKEWLAKNEPSDEHDMFELEVPLADTAPILVNYNYPAAMANVLCEGLDIQGRDDGQVSIARGLVEWRQSEFNYDSISQEKIRLLESFTNGKATLVTDEEGLPAVVLDSKEEPIVWASIARTLRIRRVIPMAELSKTSLSQVINERRYQLELEFDSGLLAVSPEVDARIDEDEEYFRLYGIRGNKRKVARGSYK